MVFVNELFYIVEKRSLSKPMNPAFVSQSPWPTNPVPSAQGTNFQRGRGREEPAEGAVNNCGAQTPVPSVQQQLQPVKQPLKTETSWCHGKPVISPSSVQWRAGNQRGVQTQVYTTTIHEKILREILILYNSRVKIIFLKKGKKPRAG